MAASTTSAITLRTKVESAFGTSPGGTGWRDIRLTGETLEPNAAYTESAEIRSDGQIGAVVRTDAEGGGAINGEFPYGEWDDWIKAVLLATQWTPATIPTITATITGAVAATGGVPDKFTAASGLDVFDPGEWVKVSGYTSGAAVLNEIYKVVEATATDLYVTGNPNFSATGSTASITITQLANVTNGKTNSTYTIEREDTDDPDTEEFHLYKGAGVQSMAMEMPTTGMITTTWNIISKIPSSPTSSTASGTSAKSTTDPITAAQIFRFLEGDPETTNITSHTSLWDTAPFKVLNMTLNVTPSLRTRKAWGTVGPALAHGRGDFDITGTVRLYYNAVGGGAGADRDDYILFRKILNDTVSGMAVLMRDGSDNVYVVDMPRVKFTGGRRNAPAKSQDVILEMDFQAFQNANDENPETGVTGTTIRFARGNHPAVGT